MNNLVRLVLWILAAVIILTAVTNAVLAATLTLTWVAPTTRVDGSVLRPEDLSAYEVFHAQDGGEYTLLSTVSSGNSVTPVLGSGAHCFYVVAVDTGGLKSAPSDTECATIMSEPSVPTQLMINITN